MPSLSEWNCDVECHQCIYLGEYDDKADDKKRYIMTMIMRSRENYISLERDNVTYKISIVLIANRKKLKLKHHQ